MDDVAEAEVNKDLILHDHARRRVSADPVRNRRILPPCCHDTSAVQRS